MPPVTLPFFLSKHVSGRVSRTAGCSHVHLVVQEGGTRCFASLQLLKRSRERGIVAIINTHGRHWKISDEKDLAQIWRISQRGASPSCCASLLRESQKTTSTDPNLGAAATPARLSFRLRRKRDTPAANLQPKCHNQRLSSCCLPACPDRWDSHAHRPALSVV